MYVIFYSFFFLWVILSVWVFHENSSGCPGEEQMWSIQRSSQVERTSQPYSVTHTAMPWRQQKIGKKKLASFFLFYSWENLKKIRKHNKETTMMLKAIKLSIKLLFWQNMFFLIIQLKCIIYGRPNINNRPVTHN